MHARPRRPSTIQCRHRAALLGAALAVGCSDPLPGDFEMLGAVVYGTVSTAAGVPAAGVRVMALAHYPDCTSYPVGASDVGTADQTGRYRVEVRQISQQVAMCAEVLVLPGDGSARLQPNVSCSCQSDPHQVDRRPAEYQILVSGARPTDALQVHSRR